jgi:hypothetical protein
MKIVMILMMKNEERILKRCLEAVESVVDGYCILDTGSTDSSKEIAEAFLKDRVGCVTQDPFRDFGYSRTKSFENAYKYLKEKTDWNLKETYGLLLDADMIFVPGTLKKQNLTDIGYSMIQKNGGMEYYNARLVRMDHPWKCVSVTHEYWDGHTETLNKSICYIDDKNDGGCKSDKFQRDKRLLEQGLIDEPNNVRYMFYLAQTYKCLGMFKESIDMYQKRIDAGGWNEEIYYSHYMIGECYLNLKDTLNFERFMQMAYKYRPSRGETIYKLAEFYRVAGEHYKSYHYIQLGRKIPFPKDDVLFIEPNVYNFLFDYEASIVEYYIHHDRGIKSSMTTMMKTNEFQNNIISNLKHYVKPVAVSCSKIDFPRPFGDTFTPSAISVCNYPLANVRFVNYKILSNGTYDMPNGIVETKNAYFNLETMECISAFDDPKNVADSHIKGLEDLRLYSKNDKLYFTATSVNEYNPGRIAIAHGEYDHENKSYKNCVGIESPVGSDCEKNWVHIPGTSDFIYGWHPLRIGTIEGNKFIMKREISVPPFFSTLRGSASPIEVNGKWLVLTHFVEYCQPRNYYHCIVELEKETYLPTKVSFPFVFQNMGIEFCISGRNIGNNELQFFVSSWDRNPFSAKIQINNLGWVEFQSERPPPPEPEISSNAKSTIVTAFFNLKKLPDSTDSVRPVEFYVKNGKKTLELPYPMVIFCDEETRPMLQEMRGDLPTKYVEKNITEYDYFKNLYPRVVENRKVVPSPDPRNTSSYFLLNMFKVYSLQLAKEENYFPETTHYAWIDLGGSHVMRGFPDAACKMLNNPRTKIACGYIHYRPDSELYPIKNFMTVGNKCAIGGTCFTVESDYVQRFYKEMFDILEEQISLGVGHADEQCMTYCYSRRPEWFSLYFADYYSLMTNYHQTVEDIDCVKWNFIEKAKSAGKTDLVEMALRSIK